MQYLTQDYRQNLNFLHFQFVQGFYSVTHTMTKIDLAFSISLENEKDKDDIFKNQFAAFIAKHGFRIRIWPYSNVRFLCGMLKEQLLRENRDYKHVDWILSKVVPKRLYADSEVRIKPSF